MKRTGLFACEIADNEGVRREKMKAERDRRRWNGMGNGYNGKHSNKGGQVVKAPNSAGGGTTKGTVVHRGNDLRTGKKK